MEINKLFENNKNWIKNRLSSDDKYFEKLGKGQSPEFLYIGCSDSRVSVEELMGLEPGDMFVHRNIANMVPINDLNSSAVIHYAVNHLKVKHIIVCGHYACGGIQASLSNADLKNLNPWIQHIRDVYHKHKAELDQINDISEKNKRLVELNVQEQCCNLLQFEDVQIAFRKGEIEIHGWVFDIHSGELIDLEIELI